MTLLFASILLFYGELDDEDESGDGDSFHLGLATFLGGLRDRPTTFLGGLATFLGGLRGGLATFLGGLRGSLANLRVIFGYDGKEEKEEDYTRKEYSYTSFSRSFTLPDNIDASKIDATYVNGELKLLLPKKEEAKKTSHKSIAVH